MRHENDLLNRPRLDIGDDGVNGISESDLGDVRRLGAPPGKIDGERRACQQGLDEVPDPVAEHRAVEQDESAIVRHWLSFFGEKLPLAVHGAFGRALQHDMRQHPTVWRRRPRGAPAIHQIRRSTGC